MRYRILIVLVCSFCICSCEEKIALDLRQSDPHLVVEGLITDEDTSYYVAISNTTKYSFKYSPNNASRESGAIVIISDNQGIVDTLAEVSEGVYKTNHIKGKVGSSYLLEIWTKTGGHYKTDYEEMLPTPEIDSFYFERDKEDWNSAYSYAITFYLNWQDPPDENNYYLWQYRYYWNGQWHDNEEWKWVLSDKYFNGFHNNRYELYTGYGGKDWSISFCQYSLSKDAFDFWQIVQKLTQEASGDELSNISAPLIGNIKNLNNPDEYVLGYFQVSAKRRISLYINE